MTFILAPERDTEPDGGFARYREYLRDNEARFPRNALALAASDWYFGADDHRAPHDAWLLNAVFEEASRGERQAPRSLALRLRLLGAYHDLELEFLYTKVFAYTFRGGIVERGHGDWLYHEFRVSESGRLLHEIRWSGMDDEATWLIEADDVLFTSRKVGERVGRVGDRRGTP
jgi:hypothetical protein